MKRSILFAFLCAFVVGAIAVTLVVAAFVRPVAFRQFLFQSKLSGLSLSGGEKSNAEIVTATNQSVVTVIAMRAVTSDNATRANTGSTGDTGLQPDTSIQRGTGTGFFIDAAGFLVTNEHVIRDADRIRVRLADGREYKATVQGADAATDIALLKIEATNLSALALADSDVLRVGDSVIAIGNPLEYEHSVTAGIVSAKGRKVYGDQPFEDFIQTDAAINRGNSGGPLLNKAGEVVGVNTVIRVDSRGISFAVPSNVVRRVVEQLRTTGTVERGYLGLRPETLTPEFREGLDLGNLQGVLVAYVSPDTPAARAGLQSYDVITTLDERPLTHADDFFSFVANSRPQQLIVVSLVRAGQKMTMHVTLDRRPPDANERQNELRPTIQKTNLPLGFSVRELSPEAVQASNKSGEASQVTSGVVISEIDPLGPAAEMRWLSGHVIVEANRLPVRNLEEFNKITANLGVGALVLRVILPNQRESRLVALRVGEGR
ncbi:MAG: trypsin-like peptidase domain-containing protein [Acidobacteriota bacterium]